MSVSNGGDVSGTPSVPEILDACCGGRFWWWDKQHPLAIYVDNRSAPPGSRPDRPNWSVEPDIVADFRELPFKDEAFQLVLFDPPHIAREQPTGNIANQFGALIKSTEQEDLRRGFDECWRVLAPGGTLVFKWAGALERVKPHFPAEPIVGTRTLRRGSGLGTRWFIFYKELRDLRPPTASPPVEAVSSAGGRKTLLSCLLAWWRERREHEQAERYAGPPWDEGGW